MTQQHNTCSNCGYYRQHYIWFQGYTKIGTGHCVHPPRTRKCYANMKACEKWIVQTDEYRNNYVKPEENEK